MKVLDKRQTHWFDQFLNSSLVGILVVDKERKNLLVSKHLCTMFGYEERELIGRSTEIFHLSHESYTKFAELASDLARQGETIGLEYQFKRKDGTLFWLYISGDMVEEHDEVLWTMVDITKRVNTEKEIKVLKERMELALLGYNAGAWEWDLSDDTAYYSPQWMKMLGYEEGELPALLSTWGDRVHPDDMGAIMSAVKSTIEVKQEHIETTHRLRHKSGRWIWILGRGIIQYDDDGKALSMVGIHTDITEQKAQQLKSAQQTQMIEQIHDSVISTDLDGIITSWNLGSKILSGYSADEVMGRHISMFYRDEDLPLYEKSIKILMRTGEYHADTYFVKKSEDVIYTSLSLSLFRDEKDEPVGMISYAQDITERKRAEDALAKQKDMLHHQAHHDALTGLPNRLLFDDRLEQAIERSKRDGQRAALFFIDLDDFKEINDSLGHEMGDEVLKIVSKRLSGSVRGEDTVARLGGDEFTIIVNELALGEDASLLAQKIIDVLAIPITMGKNVLHVSSSIGISIYPDDSESAQDLFKYADAAMYKAKTVGKDSYKSYSVEMIE